METITLKFDPKNKLIKTIINSAVLAGATIEKKEVSPYNTEFVKKIQESKRQFSTGKFKTIKTSDLWK
jgi:hypothetical protein